MIHDIDRVDDEIKRQLYTEQIQWWIKQAEEDTIGLKGLLLEYINKHYSSVNFADEAKLIQFSKDQFPQNNNTILAASTTPSTNKLPVDGPFTLITAKDRLYKAAIGGAGYPRYIDEFQCILSLTRTLRLTKSIT